MTMFGLSKRDELKVDCVTVSDRGLVRKENEDHVFVDGAKTLFAVADGMGGGSAGARASEIVCEELAKTTACGLSVRTSVAKWSQNRPYVNSVPFWRGHGRASR